MEEGLEFAFALPLHGHAQLLVDEILVHGPLDRTEDAERHRAGSLPGQPREREGETGVVAAGIVPEQPADGGVDDLERPIGAHPDAAVAPADLLAGVQSFLPELGIPRENLVFVSGIGCAARFPYYVQSYGMHSIHGRAPAIATGLATTRPDLSVWVVTGDGDALSIGGNHLIHALRRNVDVTILLFNNRIYGLTKGQYSPTSERGKVTKSTPLGSVDQPFNPLSIAIGAEATFVARAIDTDKQGTAEVLRAAAAHRGAAFIEILQNCNIYNDGAFDVVRDEKENRLYLKAGEEIRWGEKGVRMRPDGTLEIVDASVGGLLRHDPGRDDPGLAFALARLTWETAAGVPLGVFRAVSRPVYEDLVHEQVRTTIERKGEGDLRALLHGSDTWTIG